MTVKELIELLQKFPAEAEVVGKYTVVTDFYRESCAETFETEEVGFALSSEGKVEVTVC